jgi:hypothetical protein
MHNMIIEDERGVDDVDYEYEGVGTLLKPLREKDHIKRFVQVYEEIQDKTLHDQLREDLFQEMWKIHVQRSSV